MPPNVTTERLHVLAEHDGRTPIGPNASTGALEADLDRVHRTPVDPNPPWPREDDGSTSTQAGETTGVAMITSCAIRSPRRIFTGCSRSRFTTAQVTSPR